MTASVITALAPIHEEKTWTETPFKLELKGKPEKRVTVKQILDTETGKRMVRIATLAPSGVPVQPLSTLDAIARRILPNARVQRIVKGSAALIREYAVA
jgi:hypothetical protein